MKLRPFTKWIGGKRQLLDVLKENLPTNYNKYYEPFIGGGALFFEVMPPNAIINDLNQDLMFSYKAIKDDLEKLISYLQIHEKNDSKEYYLSQRNLDRDKNFKEYDYIKKAARIIYLLRVNFNGIYRVNSKNQFNVPYGDGKNKKILDAELLSNISLYLNQNNIKILNTDFENIFENVEKGDFVYFDPPYIPLNKTSAFTSYTKDKFDMETQIRLKELMDKLTKKGVYVMLSNSYTETTKELYKDYKQIEIYAKRVVNSDSNKRGKIKELIIKNY